MSAKGLGKGFGSLLPESFDNSVLLDKGERVQKVALDNIHPNPNQPRRMFDQSAIDELSQSIKRYGILQPLVVTDKSDGSYEIIAGERRFRAAKKAGLNTVPVLVRTIAELEKLEIGLIENMQRVDLSPLEQALSIARLHEQFNMTLPEIATRLGKAHTTVVNTVRLLQLPDFARDALSKGSISEGHARAILALRGDTVRQKDLLRHIIKEGWSVRQAEAYVKTNKVSIKAPKESRQKPVLNYQAEAKILTKKYGGSFAISTLNNQQNITISFKSNKDFTQFLEKLL